MPMEELPSTDPKTTTAAPVKINAAPKTARHRNRVRKKKNEQIIVKGIKVWFNICCKANGVNVAPIAVKNVPKASKMANPTNLLWGNVLSAALEV